MKLLSKLLNRLNGLRYPQEYLCLARESMTDGLHVYLVNGRKVIKNVTDSHLFVGYHPLIFAFFDLATAELPDLVDVNLSPQLLHPNETFLQKDAIATLRLKKIAADAGSPSLLFYEGVQCSHRFLPRFRQYIISLANRLNNKPGNVFLNSNLYKQVQIAYAIPRNISLITVGGEGEFNLFPTDLHGAAGDDLYVISLRHAGKACRQVLETGTILLSNVNSQHYKTVYSLGKNHMQPLKPAGNFPFTETVSDNLGLPVPRAAIGWRELKLQDSFTYGIHRVLIFRTLGKYPPTGNFSTLAHVHNVYASWRFGKGMSGNYLLR